MKRLAEELGAGVAAMHGGAFTAAFGHRSDAAETLYFLGRGETFPVGAEGRPQPRRQGLARAGQLVKKTGVGMLLQQFRDPLFDLRDQGVKDRNCWANSCTWNTALWMMASSVVKGTAAAMAASRFSTTLPRQ